MLGSCWITCSRKSSFITILSKTNNDMVEVIVNHCTSKIVFNDHWLYMISNHFPISLLPHCEWSCWARPILASAYFWVVNYGALPRFLVVSCWGPSQSSGWMTRTSWQPRGNVTMNDFVNVVNPYDLWPNMIQQNSSICFWINQNSWTSIFLTDA